MWNDTTLSIHVDDISMRYLGEKNEEINILNNVSFSVHSGEIVGLIGKSGSGKSTILKLLSGLEIPNKGEIKYILSDKTMLSPTELRKSCKIGIAFQQAALLPWRKVRGNILLPLQIKEKSLFHAFFKNKCKNERFLADVIKLVGLSNHKNKLPNELSGGMAQRVALARALVARPRLLLLDEPLSALDEILKRDLMFDLSKILRKSKITTVVVTHSIEEAVFLCDKILVLGYENAKKTNVSTCPASIASKKYIDIPEDMKRNKEWFYSSNFNENCKSIRKFLEAIPLNKHE